MNTLFTFHDTFSRLTIYAVHALIVWISLKNESIFALLIAAVLICSTNHKMYCAEFEVKLEINQRARDLRFVGMCIQDLWFVRRYLLGIMAGTQRTRKKNALKVFAAIAESCLPS